MMQVLCFWGKKGGWKIWVKRGICGILALVLVWAIAERILWKNIEETIRELVLPGREITISYRKEEWTVERLSADITVESTVGVRYFLIDNIISAKSLPDEEPLRFCSEEIFFEIYPASRNELYLNVEYRDFFRRTYFLDGGWGDFQGIYEAVDRLLEELENEKLNG